MVLVAAAAAAAADVAVVVVVVAAAAAVAAAEEAKNPSLDSLCPSPATMDLVELALVLTYFLVDKVDTHLYLY